MGNDIGSIKSVNGTSMALNTQKNGGDKPMATGNSSPGGTNPGPSPMPTSTPMPK
jgi:hypothetical protein